MSKRFPNAPPMCEDCAFRKGSPEMEDGSLQGIIDKLEDAMSKQGAFTPFYCHQGMPVDAQGYYRPKLRTDGSPKNGKLCAGWGAWLDRFQRQAVRE